MNYDINSEMLVLGAMLLQREAVAKVVNILGYNSEVFYLDKHKIVYDVMLSLFRKNEPIEVDSVRVALKDDIGRVGIQYLVELADSVITAQNVEYYAMIVYNCYLKREIEKFSYSIMVESRNGNEPDEVFELIWNGINELMGKMSKRCNIKLIGFTKDDTIKEVEDWQTGVVEGIKTGLVDIDNITNGLQEGDLWIIAGRPGAGKTTFALNVLQRLSIKNKVAFFSYEMLPSQLRLKIISFLAKVDSRKLKLKGGLNEREISIVSDVIGKFDLYNIYMNDKPLNLSEIESLIASESFYKPFRFIVIDYVQIVPIISKKRGQTRNEEIGEITRTLKNIALKYKLTVFLLSQLNRGVEGRISAEPKLSDLRDSGCIEQDADVVMFLYNENEEEQNVINVSIKKNRNGNLSKFKMIFDKPLNTFKCLADIE